MSSTYEMTLSAIGSFFDQQEGRGIFLAEVDEGFIGKSFSGDQEVELRADGFSFKREDVAALMQNAWVSDVAVRSTSSHCIDGYGVFFRAFGAECDRIGATYVSLLEVKDGFVACYTDRMTSRPVRRRIFFDELAIGDLQAGVINLT